MKLGQQVRSLRNKLGLTQKQFAAQIPGGIDCTYVGKIERDDQYPSIKLLEKMGKAFNKPLSYWFEKDTEADVLSALLLRRAVRIKALSCLFGKYCWDEGRFSVCPVTCEMQDGLCGAVKTLVMADRARGGPEGGGEIYLKREP